MTRYYHLTVWYKWDANEGFHREDYAFVTKNILNGIKNRYEKDYDKGEYAALRFEYEITQ